MDTFGGKSGKMVGNDLAGYSKILQEGGFCTGPQLVQ
jgi:hypothetical protein